MNWSPPSSSVHGISQATTLEWVTIPFSRGNFWPMDQTQISRIVGRFFTAWATREALPYYWVCLKPHSKVAICKGNERYRAENNQSALAFHCLWSFKVNIQSSSLWMCFVVLLFSHHVVGLHCLQWGIFPIIHVYIWPGYNFIEIKDIKINWVDEVHILQLMLLMQVVIYTYLAMILTLLFSSVQFSHSVVSNSVTPWTAARQASLAITNSRSLPKLMSVESVMPSNHLIFCHPLFLLPSIFSNESVCIRWPKY